MRVRRLAAAEGFTVIEVMVAMLIALMIIALLVLSTVNNSDSALASQRQAQLVAVLQQRLEYVHQVLKQNYSTLGFAALALSSNPATPTDATLPADPTDPNDFITPYVAGFVTATSVTAENFLIEKNYNHTAEGTIDGGAAYAEELQVDPTNGKIAPVSYVDITTGTVYASAASVPSADPYATVYTYVTLASVGTNTTLNCEAGPSGGSASGDARRVIVAAKLNQSGIGTVVGPNAPQYASTVIANAIPSNQCQGADGLRIGFSIS